jgi:hypothetical protein
MMSQGRPLIEVLADDGARCNLEASDLGRALAALRPRTTITCEVCGAEKEVWLRDRQRPRTCSNKCRQTLYRREKKERGT